MGKIKVERQYSCPNRKLGCREQLPLHSIPAHEIQCLYKEEKPKEQPFAPISAELPSNILEQLRSLQTTMNAISSRMDQLKSGQDAAQFDINALKSEVVQIKGQVNSSPLQRGSNQEEINTIQQQIQRLIDIHAAERQEFQSQMSQMREEMERMREGRIQGGGSKWMTRKPLSLGRCFTSSISHSGKIYAFGGSTGDTIHNVLECFDPKTNTWTKMHQMPSARCGYALVAVGDYILCLGGIEMINEKQQLSSKVEAYNVPNNQWMRATNMPSPRAYFSAIFSNNRVFCFGGLGTSNFSIFDPSTNVWEPTATPLPSERFILSAIEYKGLVYLLGGSAEGGVEKIQVDIFNPLDRTFLQEGRFEMDNINSQGAVLINNKVVCVGGIGSDGRYTEKVRILDLETKTWTEGPNLPSARSGFGVAGLNGSVYCIGGRSVGDDQNPRDLDDTLSLFIEDPR